MTRQPADLQNRFHLVGRWSDGSQTVMLGGMTWDTANRALAVVNERGIFTSVQIELDESEPARGAQSA